MMYKSFTLHFKIFPKDTIEMLFCYKIIDCKRIKQLLSSLQEILPRSHLFLKINLCLYLLPFYKINELFEWLLKQRFIKV